MIIGIVVITALGLGTVYFLAWLFRKDFRQQVEKPKYIFQQQLSKFENRQREETAGGKHDAR